jgi:NADH dehydrogenase
MAVIGRSAAVAQIGRWKLHGFLAWLAWLFIHVFYLVEFENRMLVTIQWGWNYFTRNRSARLITKTGRSQEAVAHLAAPKRSNSQVHQSGDSEEHASAACCKSGHSGMVTA